MIHHVILWKIKEDKVLAEKEMIKRDVKNELEALKTVIPGIEKIVVQTVGMDTSNCDIMLDSVFTDREAYMAYQVHPDHVKVADTYVRPNMEVRMCFDYEIE